MRYHSTRGQSEPVLFSKAILNGIAPDGGLYVPEQIPLLNPDSLPSDDLALFAAKVLAPWIENDGISNDIIMDVNNDANFSGEKTDHKKIKEENNYLSRELADICKSAFNFSIPTSMLEEDLALLELFHGPTSAFKDVGARFLAECLTRIPGLGRKTVLVATSGDTGGAVASAFYKKKNIHVVILYPKGKVSERQEHQLTAWGENIHSFAVAGDFDDCQKMAKALLVDEEWKPFLLSSNSINLGRLLPQTLYYAQSSLNYVKKVGKIPGFIVPTGNLGNGIAAFWAKKMGFPIREVVFSTNQNRPIVDYLKSGQWASHKTISTLANAMDVGNPSNIERLFSLYPDFALLKNEVRAFSVSDEAISKTIVDSWQRWGRVFCPHTATAIFARHQLPQSDWIVVSTAHASKFDTIVEPLIQAKIEVPDSLNQILSRKKIIKEVEASVPRLKEKIKAIVMG